MTIKVLIVDDHKIMAQGLASLANGRKDLAVVGIAESGCEAIRLAEELIPDIIVTGVSLPDLNGIDITRRIRAKLPEIRILALSVHNRREFVEGMFRSGASGYLLKKCAFSELIKAIREVHSGRIYLGRGVVDYTAGKSVKPSSGRRQTLDGSLSEREREVLRLISEGRRNVEIAELLGISPHTIVRHRQSIMNKLNRHSVAGLTRYAIREGITAL